MKDIEHKLFTQDATLEEKLMMQKYYFKNKFNLKKDKPNNIIKINNNKIFTKFKNKIELLKNVVKNINNKNYNNKLIKFNKISNKSNTHEMLKCGWNNRYDYFFDKMCLFDSNNKKIERIIFDDIKEFNGWHSIFPSNEELNKVKLDDEIREKIFQKFHFVNLVKTSHANFIITHIYNSFFDKNILQTETKGKNVERFITEEARDMYAFGLKFLWAFNPDIDTRNAKIKIISKLDVDIFEDIEETNNANIIIINNME